MTGWDIFFGVFRVDKCEKYFTMHPLLTCGLKSFLDVSFISREEKTMFPKKTLYLVYFPGQSMELVQELYEFLNRFDCDVVGTCLRIDQKGIVQWIQKDKENYRAVTVIALAKGLDFSQDIFSSVSRFELDFEEELSLDQIKQLLTVLIGFTTAVTS